MNLVIIQCNGQETDLRFQKQGDGICGKTHTVRKIYAIKTVSLKTASRINLNKNFLKTDVGKKS